MITVTSTRRTQPLHILLFGPPGRGKTESTITLSAKCPKAYSHIVAKGATRRQAAPVILDDLLVLNFEPSATVGWAQRNIEAPNIDFTDAQFDPLAYAPTEGVKYFAQFREAQKVLAARVASGETRMIVHDGPTFLDGLIQEATAHFHPRLEGPQFWGQVLQYHRDFLLPLMRVPATFVHIMHADSKAPDMGGKSDSAQAAAAAAELKRKAWGMADITMRLSNGAKALYRGVSALNFYVDRGLQMVDGKPVDGYWFFTENAQYDAKKRFELDAVCPADFRVILAKIAAPLTETVDPVTVF